MVPMSILPRKKSEIDAANHPPAFTANLVANIPVASLSKTPKEWLVPSLNNQVTGNGNVVGNTIKGNNNKVTGQQNCPGGICAGGDINGSPTINNYTPPQRRIPPQLLNQMSTCLSENPGTVEILSTEGNAEAWEYAEDWMALFRGANWSIDANMIKSFITGGGTFPVGTGISIRGSWDHATNRPIYNVDDPEGRFVTCAGGKITVPNDVVQLHSDGNPKGKINVYVFINPEPSGN